MPLLHKQKFVRAEIPKDLDPNQEVFFSKQTKEIFLEYDDYFERTILCNSLVWTCSLTGKQGLTFSEALDSEKKARKQLAAFPSILEKALVYIINLTKRGNFRDIIDDVLGFSKDRYFLGENILLSRDGSSKSDSQKTCKVIEILLPHETKSSKHDDSLMDVDGGDLNRSSRSQTNSQQATPVTNGLKINPDKIKYVIEIESKLNGNTTTKTIRATEIRRPLNTLTKDKLCIIIKTYFDAVKDGMWMITENAMNKFNLDEVLYTEIFKGEPPIFEVSYGRGQFSKQTKQSKSQSKSPNSKKQTESSKTSSKSMKNSKSTSALPSSNKTSNKNDHKSDKQKTMKKQTKSTSKLLQPINYDSDNEIPQQRINKVLAKRVIDMNEEEFFIWRDYKQDDELKELVQIDTEFEKILKRDKIAKEKERLKEEKRKEKQQLIELKKPKEDFDCENLQAIPKGKPVQSKISQEMLGDALIILEFLNNFGEVFELHDDFPYGFDYDLLENALFSNSCESALCNLLLFFLDSIFKCFDEETFDDVNEENESIDDDLTVPNDSDDEEVGLEQLFNSQTKVVDREEFAMLSDNFSKLVKTVQGRSVKNIGLDVYTITEMLRLYFLTAGSEHQSKAKFWYQQRGGYTRMDEIGLDFAINEKKIMKKLEKTLVFELAAEEKLKILISLCHQLMSHVRFRDLTEDNLQKVSVLKGQLRDLQTEENRRIREETSFQWKKRNEDRVKEKAKLEEIKSNIPNAQLKDETNACLEKIKLINEAENAKFLNESSAKRETFIKKEKSILNEIYEVMYKCEMYPLGKDRYFRRYWTFKSIPGVFVEDTNDNEEVNILLEGNLNRVYKQQPENGLEDYKEQAENCELQTNGKSEDEQSNGKENKPQLSDLTNLNTNNQNGQVITKIEQNLNESVNNKADVFMTDYIKDEIKWSFFTTSDDIDLLINSLNERGIRESELKQNLVDLKGKIIDNVSKKSFLIKSLTLSKEEITKKIENGLKENINSILANTLFNNPKQNKRQATKLAASLALNNFAEHVSTKNLELHLRDKIIDLEDQLFIGSLGSIKNTERAAWKESLLFEENNSPDTDETIKIKLKKFCTALLQLEQSVEKRFLRTPLGECQNTPTKKRTKPAHHGSTENDDDKYQILQNWEKSLMHCTNYSQVFVHLQSLDESIAWSKSAMNTRCRICKKKGDAERMLLCDKCDNGHHMFCLRPQLSVIPDGQWFCPECKPKDAVKPPRKIRNTFKDGDLYSDDKETEDDEADSDEEAYESDDTIEAKSDTSLKKIKKIVKNVIESTDDHSEDDEEDEGENTVEESSEDEHDDNNDSDYAVKGEKNKFKFNGFNIKNKKSNKKAESESETVEETDDDVDLKKKSNRKRKMTEEKIMPKIAKALKVNQMEPKDIIRNARSKKPVYNEISESGDTETDDDVDKKRNKKNKKQDENSTEEEFSTNTSTRNTDVEQRLKITTKLLNDLSKHKDGWPFLKPVSKREAPDYFEVIDRPMDFSTIKNNINNFKYEDYTSIIEDIRLVFQNCRDYNEPGSEIYGLNERIAAYFEKEAKKAGLLDTKQLAQPKYK